ncbi:MAG: PadR family transcriptional regulator [Candidatus Omnitrophica bacterium]|nr:PadR family transcriptional regulator [Candidatus Omnitrophota bacterium]MDE2223347.1 PadR family transcriptional regulator [Candidatus Omnitrophota bacterium]
MIENEFLFLGLLAEGAKHGYEIKRQLQEDLSPHIGIRIKSIYYPLAKLESLGMVEKEGGRREGRFPQKYVYRLTSKGRKRFEALIEQSFLSIERPFFQIDLSLYFLPLVDKNMARRRLKARQSLLKKVKGELISLHSGAGSKTLILQHGLDLIEAEINATQKIINQL